ncbi:WD40 repeat protein [Streptomyces sp. V4I23]|uniref:WD40 repeat domain-containing protein n=1 Tax=Streptomyces sp. V4I23 TaxID=3042282 RepID=UPI0027875941|nr:WD40 repeat domain-containing protein [Streptomyces sp. V4I23]MDQ1013341.1 WD40 repeat protein [Streptomyces sp. V4I23]
MRTDDTDAGADNAEARWTLKWAQVGPPSFSAPADDGVAHLAAGQQIDLPLIDHTDKVTAVTTAVVDGRPLAFIGSNFDYSVRVWDLAAGQIGEPLKGHRAEVGGLATAVVDGRPVAVALALGSFGATLRAWDLATGRRLAFGRRDETKTQRVREMATAVVDGRAAVVLCSRDKIRVLDLTPTDRLFRELTAIDYPDEVTAVATATVDGRPIAVTSNCQGSVRIWDSGTCKRNGQAGQQYKHVWLHDRYYEQNPEMEPPHGLSDVCATGWWRDARPRSPEARTERHGLGTSPPASNSVSCPSTGWKHWQRQKWKVVR